MLKASTRKLMKNLRLYRVFGGSKEGRAKLAAHYKERRKFGGAKGSAKLRAALKKPWGK